MVSDRTAQQEIGEDQRIRVTAGAGSDHVLQLIEPVEHVESDTEIGCCDRSGLVHIGAVAVRRVEHLFERQIVGLQLSEVHQDRFGSSRGGLPERIGERVAFDTEPGRDRLALDRHAWTDLGAFLVRGRATLRHVASGVL